MKIIIMLVLAGILVSIGDLVFVKCVADKNGMLLLVGLLLNLIGILVYFQTLSSEHLGIATAIFVAINILLTTIFAKVFFKQSIGSMQMVGLFVLFFGILLIELQGGH